MKKIQLHMDMCSWKRQQHCHSLLRQSWTFIFVTTLKLNKGFPGDVVVKNPPANAGDTSLIVSFWVGKIL